MQRLSDAIGSIVGSARRLIRRPSADTGADPAAGPRNYQGEREADRLGGMSAEDRAWETASRERSQEAEAQQHSSPERD
jgi:hypothetical protein